MLSNRDKALELAAQQANEPQTEQTELINLLYMLEWEAVDTTTGRTEALTYLLDLRNANTRKKAKSIARGTLALVRCNKTGLTPNLKRNAEKAQTSTTDGTGNKS